MTLFSRVARLGLLVAIGLLVAGPATAVPVNMGSLGTLAPGDTLGVVQPVSGEFEHFWQVDIAGGLDSGATIVNVGLPGGSSFQSDITLGWYATVGGAPISALVGLGTELAFAFGGPGTYFLGVIGETFTSSATYALSVQATPLPPALWRCSASSGCGHRVAASGWSTVLTGMRGPLVPSSAPQRIAIGMRLAPIK
jgi:hypothetical protein